MLCWSSGTFSGTGLDCKRMLFSSQGGRAWKSLDAPWRLGPAHSVQTLDTAVWLHIQFAIVKFVNSFFLFNRILKAISENLVGRKLEWFNVPFKISVCSRKFSLKEKLANLSANNSNLIHHFSEKPTGEAEEGVKILAFEKPCDFTALNLSNVSTYKM